MIYLDNNTFQQEIFIPRSSVKNDASPEYATKNELENAIENEVIRADEKYAAKTDLLPYATTGWVESQGFATKEWTDEQIQSAITSETERTEETYQKKSEMGIYSTTNEVENMIDSAVSGKMDTSAMSAYTKTENFATINGSAITEGGNIVIEGGGSDYSAGSNINIDENNVISVTGITVPTKVSELVNDEGYITTADTQNFVTSGDVQTQINDSISGKADSSAVTAQIGEVKAEIEAKIPSKVSSLENDLNFASTGDVESMISGFTTSADVKTQIESYNYINSGQAQTQIDNSISGKVDNSALTQYYTSEQTDTAISNAVSGKMDSSAISAYTKTEDFATINGSAITSGGNIVVEETPYSGGTNIEISNHIISVTGITVPTKLSELTNDEGFVNSSDVETQITNKDYPTKNWVQDQVSGKVDTDVFTAYTANTKIEIDGKQDISGMTAYATTAFTESTYLKEHQSLSAYSTTEQVQTLINTAKQEVENEIPDVSDFVTSAQVETQITDKGYITGYTETDPVFMASPASGISAQDITNWNSKLDASSLEPYYTSAQTDTAINNAVSGKADLSAVTTQIGEVKAEIEAKIPSKVSDLQNDLNFVNSGDVKTQVEEYDYINSGQAQTQIDNSISGKLDTDVFTAYTANTQTELSGKQDISGMTEYATTAFTESTYAKTGDIPTNTSDLINDSGFITDAALSGYATEQYVDNSISGKVDTDLFTAYTANTKTEIDSKQDISGMTEYATTAFTESTYLKEHQSLSAYTPTSGFSTINGSAITSGDNLVIEETPYTAGTNIEIIDHIISVTGITIPTSNTAFTNDAGYVTSGEVETQITDKGYITGYTESDPVFQASAASGITSQDITNWNAKLDSSDLEAYYTSAETDNAITNAVSGKMDTSAMSAYSTTEEVENMISAATDGLASEEWVNSKGFLTEHQSLSAYSTTEQMNQAIGSATAATTGWVESQGFLTEHQSLSAYTPTSGFSTINGSAITEGGNIVVEETPYSGGSNIDITDHIISVTGITVPTKLSELTNDEGFVNSGEVETQITSKGYITGYTETDPVFQASAASGITSQDISNWNNKLDSSALTSYYTSEQTDTAISNAISGKMDTSAMSAYTKTEDFATINGSAITSGGNIEIQGGSSIENYQPLQVEFDPSYSFIDAYEINSLGKQQFYKRIAFDTINGNSIMHQSDNDKVNWTIPTSTSALTNDSGYVTSGEVNTQIESKGYITDADLNGYATTAFTEQTYLKEHQSLSAYTPTSGFSTINGRSITEGGNIVIQGGGSGSDYIAGANIEITADNVINVTGITVPTKLSELTNDAGYITTETDPVFMASPASGISEQDITNWDSKLDASSLEPYYTSAQTDTAIDNAVSGKQDTLVSGVNIKTINNESLLGSGNIVIQGGSGGGSNIIELTQAEYDALTAYTEDAMYVITDAQAINMDNYVTTGVLGSYYTSAETDTAISNAVSGKTDKVSVTASGSGYKFPKWNDQGCITGTSATAYQALQSINGSSRILYSNSSSSLPTIYAPTSEGLAGQPLLSNGSGAPVWGAYKFQFISKSQYDALATKDSTTIYFIVNEN